MDIGISEKDRHQVAQGLSKLLAETYTLYLRTHYFHWNVTGTLFYALHNLFEKQYLQLASAVDVIAERIRAIGFKAPGTYEEFNQLSTLPKEKVNDQAKPESGGDPSLPTGLAMVQSLLSGHEWIIRSARLLVASAQAVKDEGTADLVTSRMQEHEKTAWMLRSLLEK